MSLPPQNPSRQPNIAVLIDGDNAQPALLEKILLEVACHGRPTIRRIYGDWTTPNMNGWKVGLREHAVTPVQQFRNSIGKNATDSTLIIDAMDILYSQSVRCFCVVSSDSDYTRLATRIREEGIKFIGIGREGTPQAFVKACDVFIYTENLTYDNGSNEDIVKKSQPDISTPPAAKSVSAVAPAAKSVKVIKKATAKVPVVTNEEPQKTSPSSKKPKGPPPLKMLKKAFSMSVQEDGWAHLGSMGDKLRQIDPAFDPRTWGYAQLLQMIIAVPAHFTLKKQTGPGAGGQYVKLSPTKK